MGTRTTADTGSFRDPAGTVLTAEGRVFRTVEQPAWDDIDAVLAAGILDTLTLSRRVIATSPIDIHDAPPGLTDGLAPRPRRIFEHERVPFISYPYEWPFSLLKRAALHHLNLHLDLLESGFTLSDASAYNVQFFGTKPVFIDVLSIRRYREGEFWAGYRQFCEQFLNPLLLGALLGIQHHAWFRGNLEGIGVEDLARILPARSRLSPRVLLHVTMHARLTSKARTRAGATPSARQSTPMSKTAMLWLVKGLRRWIEGLRPRAAGGTVWGDYEDRMPYTQEETEAKRAFVGRYADRRRPVHLFDLGCNTGTFSETALSNGATRVTGFDVDHLALETAIARADARRLNFLPLFLDAVNPSPSQGWALRERQSFQARADADGLLALALLHHIVIGRNVPLPQAIDWLVALAPSGVVEFVPKSDAMIQTMLRQRADIFPDYHIDAMRQELARRAHVVRESAVSESGRTLFEYERLA